MPSLPFLLLTVTCFHAIFPCWDFLVPGLWLSSFKNFCVVLSRNPRHSDLVKGRYFFCSSFTFSSNSATSCFLPLLKSAYEVRTVQPFVAYEIHRVCRQEEKQVIHHHFCDLPSTGPLSWGLACYQGPPACGEHLSLLSSSTSKLAVRWMQMNCSVSRCSTY